MWSANVRLWGKQRHWRLILHRSRESCTTSPGNGVETNSWPKVHRVRLKKSHLILTSPTVFLTTSLDVGQEARARESVEKHWNANKTLEQRKSDNCRRKALKKRIMLDRVENANANVANGENANANAWKGWECKCKCEDKDLSSLLVASPTWCNTRFYHFQKSFVVVFKGGDLMQQGRVACLQFSHSFPPISWD